MTVQTTGLTSVESRRRAAGLSRERLGAAAGGISSATVRRIERGLVTPHPATVSALARALDCEPRDIDPKNANAPGGEPDASSKLRVGGAPRESYRT
jgi:transcriptional regulator with XRE-family HTH domain